MSVEGAVAPDISHQETEVDEGGTEDGRLAGTEQSVHVFRGPRYVAQLQETLEGQGFNAVREEARRVFQDATCPTCGEFDHLTLNINTKMCSCKTCKHIWKLIKGGRP